MDVSVEKAITKMNESIKNKGFTYPAKVLIQKKHKKRLKCMPSNTICYVCGDIIMPGEGELDHVIPASKNGKNDKSNLRWTHRICNRVKQSLTLNELLILIKKILIYNGERI